MRKWNAVLSGLLVFLILLHAVLGSFQIFGLGRSAMKPLAWVAFALTLVHIGIGCILSWQSLCVWKRTGAPYLKENLLFWTRRLSGFAILLALFFHLFAFSMEKHNVLRLRPFGRAGLVSQILLIASLAVHLLCNIRPLLLGLGVKNIRAWLLDFLFVLSVLLLFMGAAVLVYYLRWNVW